MQSPLGLRLGGEALGTFLFFFLGFNAIAVSVDIGAGAISSLGIAFAFGLGLALAIAALGQISGGHFNPAVSLGLAVGAEVPAQGGRPVLDRAARRRLRRRARGCRRLLRACDRRARQRAGARHLELGCAPARADRNRPVRDGDLHRRDGRPRALEGRHGAAPDRALHLHCGGRDRPGLGRLVQPGEVARPRPLQLGLGKVWIYLVGPLVGGAIGGAVWVLFGPARKLQPATIRATGGLPQAEQAAPE